MSIPTIRLDDVDKNETAKRLASACGDVGFFYLDGHGISQEFISAVFNESKSLFSLDSETKSNLSDKTMSRGYTAMQEETLDTKNQTEGDTKEGYYIGRNISKDDPKYDPKKLRGPNVFPSKDVLPNFQSTMEEYHEKISNVAMKLVRLIALSLNLKESHFDNDFQNPISTLRLLRYNKRESKPDDGVYACGAHSDYGILTLLLTDENPGLQILTKDNEWIDVPPRPNMYIVNIGDMLEIWTNGRYKSTIHRVLTNVDKKTGECPERYSIPFFFDPEYETVVSCLETCTDPVTNPPKYPPTTAGKHLVSKYEQTHTDFNPTNNEEKKDD